MRADDLIFDVTTDDFAQRVLARSAEVPVVVDFWAAWCGPCHMLGPVLEKAIGELGGRVLLAKVDTDREPELAARYQVSGIPRVMAFRDGKVVDEFVGARDARFVRAFLQRVAPSEEAQQLERAVAALRAGQAAEAEALLRPLLQCAEAKEAPLYLAQALVAQGGAHLDEAEQLLGQVDPRSPLAERAEQLGRLLTFFRAADEVGGEAAARARLQADPQDLDARYGLGAALARTGRWDEALAELLEIVRRSRRYRDDGARQAMVAIFDYLGGEHAAVREYRRQLQVLI